MDALVLPQLRKWKKNVVCMCAETAKMLTCVNLHAFFYAWLCVCVCENVCINVLYPYTGRQYLPCKCRDIYMHRLCIFRLCVVGVMKLSEPCCICACCCWPL